MATTAPAGATLPKIDIHNTFGSAYIGAMIMMILYGITCLQTYMYFVRYPKDPRSLKSLVIAIWVMDTFHVGLVSHCMYHYLVDNYANPLALNDGIWSLYVSVGMNVLIGVVAQFFFVQRIHVFASLYTGTVRDYRWFITAFITIAVLAHLAFGMETMADLFIIKELSRLPEITFKAALPFAITAVLSDVFIAAALCFLLARRKTSFSSTNNILNTLIIYAINRCLLTSCVAIVEVVVFAVMTKSFWFLAIDFVIGKLYANSLLATLNTRRTLLGRGTDTEANTDDSSLAVTHTSFQIAGVSPSMVSRSRTHNERDTRVSLPYDSSRTNTSETKTHEFTELKELNSMQETRTRLSAISAEEEESSALQHEEAERQDSRRFNAL